MREFRTIPDYYVECESCGLVWTTRNAHGIGAKHARKYGHYVHVEKTTSYIYDHTTPSGNSAGAGVPRGGDGPAAGVEKE